MTKNLPIGVFDSGLGGLTVLSALKEQLPDESFVYLGDTARLPYGAKSARIVEKYSLEVCDFLIQYEVKMIVIACNTATAHAEQSIRNRYEIPVIGVIVPGVQALCDSTNNKRVGVVATRSTIKSGAYTKAILSKQPEMQVFARPCPLFVPLVEEGWVDKRITSLVIQEYLSEMVRENVDTIILGCTHYPLLKTSIQNEFRDLKLIDSSLEIARAVKSELQINNLENQEKKNSPNTIVYLTDITDQMNYLETLLGGMSVEKVEEIQL